MPVGLAAAIAVAALAHRHEECHASALRQKETYMRTSLAFAILMVSASLAAAAPLNDADCEAVWKLVDVDKKGAINPEQAKAYIADFVKVDVDKDGSIDATEFKAACKAGRVKK
jgi:Ca2+-binding EF-hand superfamily protein